MARVGSVTLLCAALLCVTASVSGSSALLQMLPELLPAGPVCRRQMQLPSETSGAFLAHVCDSKQRLNDLLLEAGLPEQPEAPAAPTLVRPATFTLEDELPDRVTAESFGDEQPEWAYEVAAWLAPMQQSVSNELCRQQSRAYLEELNSARPWALSMHDASGKLPDGFFYGNNNMLGSFDECLRVKAKLNDTVYPGISDTSFVGQYCQATISSTLAPVQASEGLQDDAQDLGLVPFLPFKVINLVTGSVVTTAPLRYGYCIPSSCTKQDVMASLDEWLDSRNGTFLYVSDVRCHTDGEKATLETNDIVVIALLAVFGVVVVLCTTLDVVGIYVTRAAKTSSGDAIVGRAESAFAPANWQIVHAFSLRYNGKRLLSTRTGSDNLGCIHGMRFLSLTWVVAGHNYIFALGGGAWNNTAYILEIIKAPAIEVLMNGLLSVDTFFCLGGIMVAYTFMKTVAAKGGRVGLMDVPMMYLHRYLRLTPVYAVVVAITATIIRRIGTGPGLGMVMENLAVQCQISWWRNLLYINNYFNYEELCVGQSWYLPVDFQLFLLSPFMIIPFVYNKKIGAVWLGLLTAASVAIPATVIYQKDLPPTTMFFNAMAAAKTEDMFTDFYVVPWCRASPYIIGIITGLILHHIKTNKVAITIPKAVNLATWTVMAAMALTIVYSTHQWNKDPQATYTMAEAVSYGSLHRLGWAIAISWVVFACVTGYGGFVDTLLSYKAFIPLGRLSYTTYLVAVQVQCWYFASYRIPSAFGNTIMVYSFLTNLLISMVLATVLSLCFESPMMTIEKIIFPKRQSKPNTKKGIDNPGLQDTPLEASTRF
ncbi:nose resistant to fluoxetine protein 6-like [Amphibalanus amphitrite]|uniref:nose resistant to fluoxetine protein 6-like n=1 Tax=Amphibalanus amphitrite TaxID=1232801 RepID=UPI001C917BA4|nr:nose resistant to fluoxetine protein 6-like [Amphibalanus amphitrite]XP_043190540.1 nose resistant to fluoxetine protein 6-like [Amphibalanus amphitrite]